jgi:hypothetical protein
MNGSGLSYYGSGLRRMQKACCYYYNSSKNLTEIFYLSRCNSKKII